MRKLELLAPAKDADTGRIAVDYGADAVYIGGPGFGARYAAGNSVEDIARLVDYARQFHVRVYAALNTLVYERELKEAEVIARELVGSGVDALIIQDPAFLRMGLEGVEFHASTQMCNTSPDRVRFLEESGFSRVILERGLTLEQVRQIRKATGVELEAFVHGAICVGFSGQCYLSRSMGPRSGNRGQCSQSCRLPFDLLDSNGNVLIAGKHLLSVRDLDLTDRIGPLVEAGVDSFKIEGRLKDAHYVKNTVSHYRRVLDSVIDSREDLCRASSGKTEADFTPDPSRSFSRGATLWMADGKNPGTSCFDTPKAVGVPLGEVERVDKLSFWLNGHVELTAGDGICFFTDGLFRGTNINKVSDGRIFPNDMKGIRPGVGIFRNYDHGFNKILDQNPARRFIEVQAELIVEGTRLILEVTDSDGFNARGEAVAEAGPARNPQAMLEAFRRQISKSGKGIFRIPAVGIDIRTEAVPFMALSAINELRRTVLDKLLERRKAGAAGNRTPAKEDKDYPCFGHVINGSDNVTNSLSRQFYLDHGAKEIAEGYDLRDDLTGQCVMTSAYCLRRELGRCLKDNPRENRELYLRTGPNCYRLEFDCRECLMRLFKV